MRQKLALNALIAPVLLAGCLISAIAVRSIIAEEKEKPEKYALLIGVTSYKNGDMNSAELKYPEEDAKALGRLFASSGYEVDYLLGSAATREAIETKRAVLNKKGNASGVVVVGLFGHGVEMNSVDYFCPYDTGTRFQTDGQGLVVKDNLGRAVIEPDPATLIKLADLVTGLKVSPAGERVVLADCCRKVPNAARSIGRAAGFGANCNIADLPDRTAVLFGCSSKQQAFEDEEWGHGAFTKGLLDEMPRMAKLGKVKTGTLMDRLQETVPKMVSDKTDGRERQMPTPVSIGTVDLQLVSLEPFGREPPVPPLAISPFGRDKAEELQRAWAKHLGKDVELTSRTTGMKFRLIPSGEFQMGSDENSDEKPLHLVKITKPFYLGVFPVTQKQYEQIMGENPSSFTGDGNRPVESVIWDNAVAFCEKLGAEEKRTYRAPSEAEWEYACRAGSTTKFYFGDDETDLAANAWYEKNSVGTTNPVGLKKPNAFGLFDMHGNVWQWCRDPYDSSFYARNTATDNPLNDKPSDLYCIRGGSWSVEARDCRSAHRGWWRKTRPANNVGFRVVREEEASQR